MLVFARTGWNSRQAGASDGRLSQGGAILLLVVGAKIIGAVVGILILLAHR